MSIPNLVRLKSPAIVLKPVVKMPLPLLMNGANPELNELEMTLMLLGKPKSLLCLFVLLLIFLKVRIPLNG